MTISSRWFVIASVIFLCAGQAAAQAPNTPVGRFSGTLRGVNLVGASDVTRYSGTVQIEPSTSTKPDAWRVMIRLSAISGYANAQSQLQWTISPGRCGSTLQPLAPAAGLPPLELRSGGNAELTYDGLFLLVPNGSFNLVVFNNGVNQANIVACSNLKYDAPKK